MRRLCKTSKQAMFSLPKCNTFVSAVGLTLSYPDATLAAAQIFYTTRHDDDPGYHLGSFPVVLFQKIRSNYPAV